MKFFFDRQISVHIARMIAHFERDHDVVHQDDDSRFNIDDDDVSIINTLASETPKPVWITADVSQKKDPKERAALRDSGMNIFFFKGFFKNRTPHMQSLKVLGIWPKIVERVPTVRVPTAFEIPFGHIGANLSEKIDTLGHTNELFK